MYCLHCRFQVVEHHIGSDSNHDLDPEFPGYFLDSFALCIICPPTNANYSDVYIYIYIYIYIYVCVCVCVCVCFIYIYVYIYICGAFNKFPDIFVLALKFVVDSWKFTMLFQYILWNGRPIFMISGSNEQLQQQLEYTLLKTDCHSW